MDFKSVQLEEHARSVLSFLQSAGDGDSGTHGVIRSDVTAWDQIIHEPLARWIADPSQLVDDNVEPPTTTVLEQGFALARLLRDLGAPAPLRLTATGDGGIAFEFERDCTFDTVEIAPDLTIEIVRFSKSRLVHRQQLVLHQLFNLG